MTQDKSVRDLALWKFLSSDKGWIRVGGVQDEDENGDGTFDLATEDRFIYEYWYQDTGWNLISYKYSDIQFDEDGNQVSTNGNGKFFG